MLAPGQASERSAAVRQRVVAARAYRTERLARSLADGDSVSSKAAMPELLEARNRVGAQAKCLLREALLRQGLGGRGYVRTINLARTIADLDAVSDVTADHVAEALSLRLDYRRIGFG